tara:strand:- start:198 stop:530 length:333 start_codon:yes stop_codon:yes gene_type:complete
MHLDIERNEAYTQLVLSEKINSSSQEIIDEILREVDKLVIGRDDNNNGRPCLEIVETMGSRAEVLFLLIEAGAITVNLGNTPVYKPDPESTAQIFGNHAEIIIFCNVVRV